ncbi:MAG: hypothetical protein HC763_20950 [Hydrococcus sp. CRU_1_1]|nr:hypothetical protein [Hydrococcus sp. CRU_1_1]
MLHKKIEFDVLEKCKLIKGLDEVSVLLTRELTKPHNDKKERKNLTAVWRVIDDQLTCQWIVE